MRSSFIIFARYNPGVPRLPPYIEPMLAKAAGEAFDSDDWLFEVKWDGFRCLAFRDDTDSVRLLGRRKTSFAADFPEVAAALMGLPPGVVLDGELVAMVDGKPSFPALLHRQRSDTARRRTPAPATFIAFDLLCLDFKTTFDQPLHARREALQSLVAHHSSPRLVMSQGIIGQGVQYFEQARQMELEGVMAKRLAGKYEPGKRSGSWLKIKRRGEMLCAVIGYEPSEERGMRSLIIAAPIDGELVFVGQVGSGITQAMHEKLLLLLNDRLRKTPVVACNIKGRWIEPDLFVRISYLEMLASGKLRGPVFLELIER